jgi:hypothetical protein
MPEVGDFDGPDKLARGGIVAGTRDYVKAGSVSDGTRFVRELLQQTSSDVSSVIVGES